MEWPEGTQQTFGQSTLQFVEEMVEACEDYMDEEEMLEFIIEGLQGDVQCYVHHYGAPDIYTLIKRAEEYDKLFLWETQEKYTPFYDRLTYVSPEQLKALQAVIPPYNYFQRMEEQEAEEKREEKAETNSSDESTKVKEASVEERMKMQCLEEAEQPLAELVEETVEAQKIQDEQETKEENILKKEAQAVDEIWPAKEITKEEMEQGNKSEDMTEANGEKPAAASRKQETWKPSENKVASDVELPPYVQNVEKVQKQRFQGEAKKSTTAKKAYRKKKSKLTMSSAIPKARRKPFQKKQGLEASEGRKPPRPTPAYLDIPARKAIAVRLKFPYLSSSVRLQEGLRHKDTRKRNRLWKKKKKKNTICFFEL